MREYNAVREGLKRHATAHDFYLTLKEKAHGKGMCASEWDWYRARQKEWEPEVQAKEMADTRRRMDIEAANRLSTEDLQAILTDRAADDRRERAMERGRL